MSATSPGESDRERWQRVEAICDAALRLEGPARTDYLEAACAGDAALLAEVQALLAHEQAADRFLHVATGAVPASVMTGGDDLTGTRLGDYEVAGVLGEGGMGRVYRAHDTRLDRDVALKVVLDIRETADGGSRRLRHEARAAARLNHPNICTVYEVAAIDGATCIAMELIQGTTLRQQLAKGAFSPDRVCRVGRQIAEALEHAHAHGVIHRDLKSSNVMIRADGHVKVIDFGIADRAVAPGDQTQTPRTLAGGGLRGTLAYIAPELLQGAQPDTRSDIWSLGIMLYEMAAGRLPFDGKTESDLAAAILRDPLPPLPRAVPPGLVALIERCLSRTPQDRPARSGEVALALDVAGRRNATPANAGSPAARWLMPVAIGAAVLLAIGAVAVYPRYTSSRSGIEPVIFENAVQVTNAVGVEESPAWSPDGRMLAYSASSAGGVDDEWHIWVVQPGSGSPLNRTEGFEGQHRFPAWSPNGSQLAFWSSHEGGGCYVMPALAGGPRRVAATGNAHISGPEWSADGNALSCVVGNNNGEPMFAERVTVSIATGREVSREALPGGARPRMFVTAAPDGRHTALVPADGGPFTDVSELLVVGKDSSVVLQTDGKTRVWSPKWSADARTLYYLAHAGSAMSVWAQRFDAAGATEGAPRVITTGMNIRDFGWSADGRRLAYSLGRRISNVYRVPFTRGRVSSWADVQQLTFDQADIQCVALDRTGSRLVVTSDRSGSLDLWAMAAGGGPLAQLTSDPSAEWCADWSPDGKTLAFYAYRSGNRDIWTIPSGGGPWRQITDAPNTELHPKWSFDARQFVYTSTVNNIAGVSIRAIDGGPVRRMVGGFGITPSPIDNRFATRRRNDSTISIGTLDAPERLEPLSAKSTGAPSWTPDAGYLLTRATHDRIGLVAVDGRSPEQLLVNLSGRPGSLGIYGMPTDGKFIYFVWAEDVGDIWVMDVAK